MRSKTCKNVVLEHERNFNLWLYTYLAYATRIVHYCVANMPGGVPRTSTLALSNATLPFTLALAEQGTDTALRGNPHLLNGLNVCAGVITDRAVADTFDLDLVDPLAALDLR